MTNNTRLSVAAGLLAAGALLLVPDITSPAQAVSADSIAAAAGAAAQPRPGYVVFFERGQRDLSPAARDTIRLAARSALARHARIVRVVGRIDQAAAVKAELVRQGVAADAVIFAGRDESRPLVKASDGVAEPVERKVLIAF